MGCGIASVFAATGYLVRVFDCAKDSQELIRQRTADVFQELVSGKRITESRALAATARLRPVEHLGELAQAALIVEAIVESAEEKGKLFSQLEQLIPEATIIASSTSGIQPNSLNAHLLHPERFLVAHFWNPPHLIPLVEVVPSERTSKAVVDATMHLLKRGGCDPVLLTRAVAGFIGNRIQFAVLREALHLVHLGVADPETIDSVVKRSLGRRYRWIGPLEGADAGGLDTFLTIGSQLMPTLATEDGLELLRELVEQGNKGRSSGQGIYKWNAEKELRFRQARLNMLLDSQ